MASHPREDFPSKAASAAEAGESESVETQLVPTSAVEEEKSLSAVGNPLPQQPTSKCECEPAVNIDSMPDEELLYDLADLFKVFGDTTRIKILCALMGKDLCVAEIAEVIGATQSAVSHQLRTLKQARLVRFQRDGKSVIYSLADDHVYTVLSQGMNHICE